MKKALMVSAIFGIVIATTALVVGIKHNPMGEFCMGQDLDNCKLDLFYAAQLWFMWFIPVFAFQAVCLYVIKFLVFWIKKLISS